MHKAKGKELIFISRILRDGSGVEKIEHHDQVKHLDDEGFELHCLSISNETYIASGFNSYVVKIKNKDSHEG